MIKYDELNAVTTGKDKNELAKKTHNTKTTLRKNTVQNINNGMINNLEKTEIHWVL